MTVKPKKTKLKKTSAKRAVGRKAKTGTGNRRKARPEPAVIGDLRASIEEDLMSLTDGYAEAGPRWNRPRKQQISLRVDKEVVDWLKSKGAGYQTRINRILRRVMVEDKKREEN